MNPLVNKNRVRAYKSYHLGMNCVRSENYTEALAHICAAGVLLPEVVDEIERFRNDLFVALNEVTKPLARFGKFTEIILWINQLQRIFPTIEELPHKLGCLLYESGDYENALKNFNISLQINPHYNPSKMCIENIGNMLVERWHYRMLNDTERNTKYRSAICRAVAQDQHTTVLDIGTGTGLLAMFAAQAGAHSIYACEESPAMFRICQEILKKNNLEEKINLHNKLSTRLKIPNDLPKRVSLVATEIFDAGLFGEDVLKTLDHAWKHLLLPPLPPALKGTIPDTSCFGRVVPHLAHVHFVLIESVWLRKKFRVFQNKMRTIKIQPDSFVSSEGEPYTSGYLSKIPGGFRTLSEPKKLLSVDFNNPEEIESLIDGVCYLGSVTCSNSGTIDGVATWFDLWLDESTVISTSHLSQVCWEQAVYPLKRKLEVTSGSTVYLDFKCENHLTLERVSLQSKLSQLVPKPEEPIIPQLSSSWISLLNNNQFCSVLEASIVDAISAGKTKILDASVCPLGAIIALKLGAEKVTVIGSNQQELLKICSTIDIGSEKLKFSTVEEICCQEDVFDVFIFEPLETSGVVNSKALEDFLLLRSTCLAAQACILPSKLELYGVIARSKFIIGQCKMLDQVEGLAIDTFINKYQTSLCQSLRPPANTLHSITPVINILEFDFASESCVKDITNGSWNRSAKTLAKGKLDCVLYWAKLVFNSVKDLNVKWTVNTSKNESLFAKAAFVSSKLAQINRDIQLKATCVQGTICMEFEYPD